MLKTDFKDLIPVGGKKLYQVIDDKTGAAIYNGVRIERANGNVQDGDKYGSAEVNEERITINEIIDGSIKVKNTENSDKVPWSGVSNKPSVFPPSSHNHDTSYFTKDQVNNIVGNYTPITSGFGSTGVSLTSNALSVPKNMITYAASGQTTNMPPRVEVAILQKYILNVEHYVVIAYETIPNKGNVWINTYFGGWTGWRLTTGKVDLWSGTAASNATITIAGVKSSFKSIDVFFNVGERINCPFTDGNEDMWGSLITTAGTQFYLKSAHLQFTSANQIKIVSCQELDLATGKVGNKTITKIVGRP